MIGASRLRRKGAPLLVPAAALLLGGRAGGSSHPAPGALGARDSMPEPRLYVLDCGRLAGRNLRTYGLPPEPRDMAVPCYLIVHRDGMLLWETGLGDRFAGGVEKRGDEGWRVGRTLREQLAELGVGPADITYLAISHMHADHVGNADDYAGATWLVQEAERQWAFSEGKDTVGYGALSRSEAVVLHGEYDVFGDGTAVLEPTPGHTPGHQSLLVRLPDTGAILLSGDLYHYPEERTYGKVPSFEFDRGRSAASRVRMDSLMEATGARLWIGHDIRLYGTLEKAPAYYR